MYFVYRKRKKSSEKNHPDKSDLINALLKYNSEITEKKRKRNEATNALCSEIRNKDQQEYTSTNRDYNKDRDEHMKMIKRARNCEKVN